MMSIPDDYMIQLGRMVVASSELESKLHRIFTALASEKAPGHLAPRDYNVVVDVLLADDSLRQQIQRLGLLAKRHMTINGETAVTAFNRVVDDDRVSSLEALIERCDKARITRNGYVHARWETDSVHNVWRMTKRQLRMNRELVLLDDLRLAAQEVEDAVLAAHSFHLQVLAGVIYADFNGVPGLDDLEGLDD